MLVTAGVLLWLGTVLTRDAATAMDGFTRLLFTAVPVQLFAWTLAAVFVLLGVRIAQRSLSKRPTLTISDSGLGLPDGRVLPWQAIDSAEPTQANLQIRIAREPSRSPETPLAKGWRSRFSRRSTQNTIVMSAFDLGAHPSVVAAAIASARTNKQGDQ
jgi:hypothetical protein